MAKASEFKLELTVDPPLSVLAEMYRDMATEFADMRPYLRSTVNLLRDGLARNIIGQGGPIGESWEPLSPGYASRKMLDGFSAPIMQRTGGLLGDIRSARVLKETKTSIQVGITGKKASKAAALTFGSDRVGIPSREFLGWSAKMKSDAERLLGDHIQNILDKAAGQA